MKYPMIAAVVLFAAHGALAQSTTPAEASGKSAVVKQPATGAAAAKNVGTTDRTAAADAYMKAQEKKRSAMAKKYAAAGGDPKATATKTNAGERPGSMMTEEERAAHRKKLQSFKTLAECETYDKQHQAEMEARAKAQQKTLRAPTGSACNRYQPAAGKAAAAAGSAAPK